MDKKLLINYTYSEVVAQIRGHIDSIKNPKSGIIIAGSVGEIIREDTVMKCCGEVCLREQRISA